MYLLKYLASCGVCSRRKAAELIKQGLVSVNGKIETSPFVEVDAKDNVLYRGKRIVPEKFIYILLNKPKDYVTTCSDERGRKTVLDLLEGITMRVYPVGRLDRVSTGLLVITNDGELAQKLSHPSSNVLKQYRVLLDKPLMQKDYDALLEGFQLEDCFIKADSCVFFDKKNKNDLLIEIHSGQNRIVRRMFDHLGYHVEKLDRVGYAGLGKAGSVPPRGLWRFLTDDEVARLHKLAKK